MTGRGIDQILPYPNNPVVYEPYVKDAREYVRFAEEKNGEIPKPVNFDYIWGDTLNHLERLAPDLRIINLETSITASEEYTLTPKKLKIPYQTHQHILKRRGRKQYYRLGDKSRL
jgi:poly-gamma-glutamate capsule biosynthesis protein CapA/YwtB (metallophosphatase superfamily)